MKHFNKKSHARCSTAASASSEKHVPASEQNYHPHDRECIQDRITNRTRLTIVYIAAVLALLSFIAFLITGDPRTLLGTSVLAYPLFKIVDYYFSRPENLL